MFYLCGYRFATVTRGNTHVENLTRVIYVDIVVQTLEHTRRKLTRVIYVDIAVQL